MRKARGHRGSWHAWIDGVPFACIHDYFMDWQSSPPRYHDPVLHRPLRRKYVEAIMTGQVILTKVAHLGNHRVKRLGYKGRYRVKEVVFDATGLRFELGELLEPLR